jgi:uncharacterized protein
MKSRKNSPRGDQAADSVTLSLRIQPRASKNEAIVMEGGGLKIRLTAPPVDGAANDALVRFLAETFAVSRSQVEIVSGHASRDKIVRISGVNEADVKRILNTQDE